ncbi:MAG: CHAP domain-containing protein [Coleofasciculaceae cyanobacterium SM2_1_6]|nr:CHAP domain-containing protein [Coleofasciculaceae cyanobacterium SM2_1_6]
MRELLSPGRNALKNAHAVPDEDLELFDFGEPITAAEEDKRLAGLSLNGGYNSMLGDPTSGVMTAGTSPQGTTGYWQSYQNGMIHSSGRYGAVPLWFDLAKVYAQNGGSSNWLGFPTRAEYEWEFGKRTDFEGGYLFFNPQNGSVRAYKLNEIPQRPVTNQPPKLSFPNFIMPYGRDYYFTLGQYRHELEISDPNGDEIQFYEIKVDPTKIDMEGWSYDGQPSGTFLMPADQLNNVRFYGSVLGTYPVQIRAYDGKAWSDSHTFNLTVNPAVKGITIGGGGNPKGGNASSLLSPLDADYFLARPQFYTSGNPFFPYNAPVSVGGTGGLTANCTWYASGRIKEMGGNTAALASMLGNANQWHNQLSNGATISSTPRVGDIAQWSVNGENHVAVVEKVNADGSIIISESNYAGMLHHTRTIAVGAVGAQATGWPDRFIRILGASRIGSLPLITIIPEKEQPNINYPKYPSFKSHLDILNTLLVEASSGVYRNYLPVLPNSDFLKNIKATLPGQSSEFNYLDYMRLKFLTNYQVNITNSVNSLDEEIVAWLSQLEAQGNWVTANTIREYRQKAISQMQQLIEDRNKKVWSLENLIALTIDSFSTSISTVPKAIVVDFKALPAILRGYALSKGINLGQVEDTISYWELQKQATNVEKIKALADISSFFIKDMAQFSEAIKTSDSLGVSSILTSIVGDIVGWFDSAEAKQASSLLGGIANLAEFVDNVNDLRDLEKLKKELSSFYFDSEDRIIIDTAILACQWDIFSSFTLFFLDLSETVVNQFNLKNPGLEKYMDYAGEIIKIARPLSKMHSHMQSKIASQWG